MESQERQIATKRLHRRLKSARWWTVATGVFGASAAFLVPYGGVAAVDVVWVGMTGFSASLSFVRWGDYRRTSQAMPQIRDSLALYGPAGLRDEARNWKTQLATSMRSSREKGQFRGSVAAKPYQRLMAASESAEEISKQMDPDDSAYKILQNLADAGPSLRDLAFQIRGIEKTISTAPAIQKDRLKASRSTLAKRLENGVAAYEEMVVAAGECLSQQQGLAHALESVGDDPTLERLSDAAVRLRADADAAEEVRGTLESPSNGSTQT